MRSLKTEGIVIKRQNFGEADIFLTIFTKRFGKMKILAKGVRRIHSRRGPNIEFFNQGVFFIHKDKTFDMLTEVMVLETFPRIRKKLELIGLAYHVCELIEGLCAEHQPHPKVYDLFIEVLQELDQGLIQRFETALLMELGFLPKNRDFSINTTFYIEQILERRLKSKKFLAKLKA